jgi:hypothetical protein
MMRTRTTLLFALLLAPAAPTLVAAEEAEDHAAHPQKVIAIGESRIVPDRLRMSTGDVLTFQNHSGQILRITFLEPADLRDKVKCRQIERLSENEALVPGALFKRRGDRVVGLIAPGAFVSVCSLAPGRYTYTTSVARGAGVGAPGEPLGQKGEIIVE